MFHDKKKIHYVYLTASSNWISERLFLIIFFRPSSFCAHVRCTSEEKNFESVCCFNKVTRIPTPAARGESCGGSWSDIYIEKKNYMEPEGSGGGNNFSSSSLKAFSATGIRNVFLFISFFSVFSLPGLTFFHYFSHVNFAHRPFMCVYIKP